MNILAFLSPNKFIADDLTLIFLHIFEAFKIKTWKSQELLLSLLTMTENYHPVV